MKESNKASKRLKHSANPCGFDREKTVLREHFLSQSRGRNRWQQWDRPRFTDKAAVSKQRIRQSGTKRENKSRHSHKCEYYLWRLTNKPILCDKGDHVESNTFMVGNVKNYIDAWKRRTSDSTILTAINGYKIDFSSSLLS